MVQCGVSDFFEQTSQEEIRLTSQCNTQYIEMVCVCVGGGGLCVFVAWAFVYPKDYLAKH